MEKVSAVFSDRMRVIWYNWMVVLLWIFCYSISAFAGAVAGKSSTYGFLAIWDMLLLVALGVGGTLILRNVNYRTPLAVGFLIGSSFMMVQLMLVTGVISGSMGSASGVQAVTAFASLLLIFLGTFTVFVTLWRDTLLPPPAVAEGASEGLPPPQFGSGAAFGAPQYGGAGGEEAGYGGAEHHDVSVAPPTGGGGVL